MLWWELDLSCSLFVCSGISMLKLLKLRQRILSAKVTTCTHFRKHQTKRRQYQVQSSWKDLHHWAGDSRDHQHEMDPPKPSRCWMFSTRNQHRWLWKFIIGLLDLFSCNFFNTCRQLQVRILSKSCHQLCSPRSEERRGDDYKQLYLCSCKQTKTKAFVLSNFVTILNSASFRAFLVFFKVNFMFYQLTLKCSPSFTLYTVTWN